MQRRNPPTLDCYSCSSEFVERKAEMGRERKLAFPGLLLGFTLLEYRPAATPDEVVIGRETFWKDILLSRQHG